MESHHASDVSRMVSGLLVFHRSLAELQTGTVRSWGLVWTKGISTYSYVPHCFGKVNRTCCFLFGTLAESPSSRLEKAHPSLRSCEEWRATPLGADQGLSEALPCFLDEDLRLVLAIEVI